MFLINNEQQSHGSINRVYFDPSITLIPSLYQGKKAYDLLSTHAIKQFYQSKKCQFPNIYEVDDFRNFFKDYGQIMAYMFYILKNGYDLKLQRVDWQEDDWVYWSKVKKVILGGGIVETFGQHFIPALKDQLATLGVNLSIELHPNPEQVVLHGLRYHIKDQNKYLLLDFGNTRVKVFTVYNNKITNHKILLLEDLKSESATDLILSVLKTEGIWSYDKVYLSVASYLKNGRPISALGIYGKIGKTIGSLADYLKDELDYKGHIKVFHDASVAADPYRDEKHTVVMTLGTALGIGYI